MWTTDNKMQLFITYKIVATICIINIYNKRLILCTTWIAMNQQYVFMAPRVTLKSMPLRQTLWHGWYKETSFSSHCVIVGYMFDCWWFRVTGLSVSHVLVTSHLLVLYCLSIQMGKKIACSFRQCTFSKQKPYQQLSVSLSKFTVVS